jgi:hypothetical protein
MTPRSPYPVIRTVALKSNRTPIMEGRMSHSSSRKRFPCNILDRPANVATPCWLSLDVARVPITWAIYRLPPLAIKVTLCAGIGVEGPGYEITWLKRRLGSSTPAWGGGPGPQSHTATTQRPTLTRRPAPISRDNSGAKTTPWGYHVRGLRVHAGRPHTHPSVGPHERAMMDESGCRRQAPTPKSAMGAPTVNNQKGQRPRN